MRQLLPKKNNVPLKEVYDIIKREINSGGQCGEKRKRLRQAVNFCNNLVYDDEIESYVCDVNMDEDDYARFLSSSRTYCPYYQSNDEYKIVRHQM